MSKLLRTELKEIVKECLIEILSEGLFSNTTANISETKNFSKKTNNIPAVGSNKGSYLDNISYNKQIENKKSDIRKNVMKSNITSDPILNELLADTAASTLQEQTAAESRNNAASNIMLTGDHAAKLVNQSSPEDLFGESSSKWAQLAFSR